MAEVKNLFYSIIKQWFDDTTYSMELDESRTYRTLQNIKTNIHLEIRDE